MARVPLLGSFRSLTLEHSQQRHARHGRTGDVVPGKGAGQGHVQMYRGCPRYSEGLQEAASSLCRGPPARPVPKGQRGLGQAPCVGVWASL